MAPRNKPYDQFGPFILFKKLEVDALGELWRAGRIEGTALGTTVALRRMTGGDRAAMAAGAEAAAHLLPQLSGTSFAREQAVGVIDGTPYLAWSYAGGRSLRHIIDRARGGKDVNPNPLPLDQAIVIAEKVALSLATMSELRDGAGQRLSHGALIPQFVWISDDGEIRVAGQQLGSGIRASLGDAKIAHDIGRYFSPESRGAQTQAKNADVYSMGAILFLLVTGQEPPDAATASAFVAAVRAAKTTMGAAVPDDIRVILDKSFNLDPSMRYASIGDMKQALSALANSGRYSATTFNLAFYLSTLLKKEMEAEAIERDKEGRVNVAPYLESPKTAPVSRAEVIAAAEHEPPMFASAEPRPRSRMPLAIAAAVVLAGAGFGAWMMMNKQTAAAATPAPTTSAQMIPTAKPAPVMPEPIVAGAPATGGAATGTGDAEAQKKAFEDAVRRKMQEEMMKLQSDFMKELKQNQSKNAPVGAAPAPAQAEEERPSLTAAQLDAQRREAEALRQEQLAAARNQREQQPQQAAAPAVTQTQAPASAPVPVPQQQAPATPAPVPAAASVREGDVVDVGDLDSLPRPTRPISVVYPPIARQQKIAATVILSVFITESGNVQDVRVLRGDARFGLNEAAMRAIRAAKFTPAMKDGKRVKTWLPQTITFQP